MEHDDLAEMDSRRIAIRTAVMLGSLTAFSGMLALVVIVVLR